MRPEPAALLDRARALAAEVDPELAWEFAPDADFGFAELAREYFDAKADAVHQAAMLLGLFQAPHYFKRVGKGVFHKASRETVQAALLAIERKKAQAAQVDAWATELIDGRCAEPIRAQLYRILFKPDKNATEYKAVVEAARRAQRAPLDLLRAAGAIESPYQFHWRRFLYEQFPRGTGFADAPVPDVAGELPLADAQAFSIDDSSTTEIDDALSVRGLGSGTVVLGIHIAAPALAIAPDSSLDRVARERLSTVYMPGHKITMLPDAVVQRFTLSEGRDSPALSLYVQIDESSLELRHFETRIERLHVSDNLRHDQLDARGHRGLAARRRGRRLSPCGGTRIPVPPGQSIEGPARAGARQARDLQSPGLQLPPRRADGRRARAVTRTCRSRRGFAARRWI